mmetsp:Transcript_42207/g.98520  ORF Transcript_42207/g.98520 Transcript_42207/m.98520 type:complete len:275 (-) Transcript_42207:186-1010(-)
MDWSPMWVPLDRTVGCDWTTRGFNAPVYLKPLRDSSVQMRRLVNGPSAVRRRWVPMDRKRYLCKSGATSMHARRVSEGAPVVGVSNCITVLVILTMSILQVLRREVAPLCTLGVIVANIVTKALKQVVKQTLPPSVWRRPLGSRRDSSKDPGFPSSHTSIMTFISVYFALYLGLHLGWPFREAALVAVLPSGTMAAARIWDKDHTIQQTLGGVAWGCCMGMWWALIGPRLRGILEWAEPQPWALVILCFGVGLPMFTKPLGVKLPSKVRLVFKR